MQKRKVPHFENERDEALWWDRNRKEFDKDFVKAAQDAANLKQGLTDLQKKVDKKKDGTERDACRVL